MADLPPTLEQKEVQNLEHVTDISAKLTANLLLEVARGNIPGWKMYAIAGRKENISNTQLDDLSQIPGTIRIPDPGGIQMEIVSSNVNDTVAGTGAQIIMIHYLDTNGLEQQEQVNTNGTTPVNTIATNIDKIQWIHVFQLGAGVTETALGNISLRDTAGTITYDYILSGTNQSLSAHYHIPTGKTGYILGWQVSAITKVVNFTLRATVMRFNRALISNVFLFQDLIVLDASASGWIPFEVPLKCPAGTEIKISATSSAAGGDGSGQFDILLIDD